MDELARRFRWDAVNDGSRRALKPFPADSTSNTDTTNNTTEENGDERRKARAGENYSAEVRKRRRTYQQQMEDGMPRLAANDAATEMPDVDPFHADEFG